MNRAGHFKISAVAAGLVLPAAAGCRKPVPPGALVLTQSPATAPAAPAADILDARYPANSRVVLVEAPFASPGKACSVAATTEI